MSGKYVVYSIPAHDQKHSIQFEKKKKKGSVIPSVPL